MVVDVFSVLVVCVSVAVVGLAVCIMAGRAYRNGFMPISRLVTVILFTAVLLLLPALALWFFY